MHLKASPKRKFAGLDKLRNVWLDCAIPWGQKAYSYDVRELPSSQRIDESVIYDHNSDGKMQDNEMIYQTHDWHFLSIHRKITELNKLITARIRVCSTEPVLALKRRKEKRRQTIRCTRCGALQQRGKEKYTEPSRQRDWTCPLTFRLMWADWSLGFFSSSWGCDILRWRSLLSLRLSLQNCGTVIWEFRDFVFISNARLYFVLLLLADNCQRRQWLREGICVRYTWRAIIANL